MEKMLQINFLFSTLTHKNYKKLQKLMKLLNGQKLELLMQVAFMKTPCISMGELHSQIRSPLTIYGCLNSPPFTG